MNSGYNTTEAIPFDKAEEILKNLIKNEPRVLTLYWAFGIYTALRIGDILKLRWEDVNEQVNRTEEQKTSKRRIVFLSDKLKNVIKLYRQESGYIFASKSGKPYSQRHVNNWIRQVLVDNRVSPKRQSSHMLRKTFATELYHRTKDIALVSKALNHGNIKTTMSYICIDDELVIDAYKMMGEL